MHTGRRPVAAGQPHVAREIVALVRQILGRRCFRAGGNNPAKGEVAHCMEDGAHECTVQHCGRRDHIGMAGSSLNGIRQCHVGSGGGEETDTAAHDVQQYHIGRMEVGSCHRVWFGNVQICARMWQRVCVCVCAVVNLSGVLVNM